MKKYIKLLFYRFIQVLLVFSLVFMWCFVLFPMFMIMFLLFPIIYILLGVDSIDQTMKIEIKIRESIEVIIDKISKYIQ